jgi:hypothetical protein
MVNKDNQEGNLNAATVSYNSYKLNVQSNCNINIDWNKKSRDIGGMHRDLPGSGKKMLASSPLDACGSPYSPKQCICPYNDYSSLSDGKLTLFTFYTYGFVLAKVSGVILRLFRLILLFVAFVEILGLWMLILLFMIYFVIYASL